MNMSKLLEQNSVYRPFAFPWAVDMAAEHEKMHWVESEIAMGEDVSDWKRGHVSASEKEFVTQILRMFTTADAAVGSYYYDVLMPKLRNNEIRMMMGSFAAREGIHQRAYALLNDTLGLPEGDYAAFRDYIEMKDKLDFMLDADPTTDEGMGMALAKGVFNEGVSLFASFVMLLHFQQRGLMKGMCKVVEWSIRDEGQHVEGLSKVFKAYCADFPHIVTDGFKHAVYDLSREVVRLEDAFIDLAYASGPVEGLTSTEVKTYIRFIADRRLVQLGLRPNFMVEMNPLPWLDWVVSGTRHTNFFENSVSSYEVAGLEGEWDYGQALPTFTIYTRQDCPWCVKVKNLLISQGAVFQEVDLSDTAERAYWFNDRGFYTEENRTLPKVYVEGPTLRGQLIGGFTETADYLSHK